MRTSYVHGPLWQTFSPLRSLAPSEKGEKEISRDRERAKCSHGIGCTNAASNCHPPHFFPERVTASGVREGLKERARSQIEISIDCAAWSPARLCTNAALSTPFKSSPNLPSQDSFGGRLALASRQRKPEEKWPPSPSILISSKNLRETRGSRWGNEGTFL